MNPGLEDKVVLITGTGGGQGRAAALRFAEAGAHVFGCDVKADGNRETAAMVRAANGSIVTTEPVDLGDPEQARQWIDRAAAVYGRIDVLYNNASACRFAPIEEYSVEDWRFSLRNELDLVFYACKFAWPYLKRQGGVILNTASISGLIAFGEGVSGHCAAKGAVIALTKSLAAEGAPHGIRALSICPGPIESPGSAAVAIDPQVQALFSERTLLKRFGKADEIAKVALFLASDAASFMTGNNVVIDGGMVAV